MSSTVGAPAPINVGSNSVLDPMESKSAHIGIRGCTSTSIANSINSATKSMSVAHSSPVTSIASVIPATIQNQEEIKTFKDCFHSGEGIVHIKDVHGNDRTYNLTMKDDIEKISKVFEDLGERFKFVESQKSILVDKCKTKNVKILLSEFIHDDNPIHILGVTGEGIGKIQEGGTIYLPMNISMKTLKEQINNPIYFLTPNGDKLEFQENILKTLIAKKNTLSKDGIENLCYAYLLFHELHHSISFLSGNNSSPNTEDMLKNLLQDFEAREKDYESVLGKDTKNFTLRESTKLNIDGIILKQGTVLKQGTILKPKTNIEYLSEENFLEEGVLLTDKTEINYDEEGNLIKQHILAKDVTLQQDATLSSGCTLATGSEIKIGMDELVKCLFVNQNNELQIEADDARNTLYKPGSDDINRIPGEFELLNGLMGKEVMRLYYGKCLDFSNELVKQACLIVYNHIYGTNMTEIVLKQSQPSHG